jgi:hypothetical protein
MPPKKLNQTQRLLKLLKDKEWHDTAEIQEKVYGRAHLGCARIGARIWELRRVYRYAIAGRKEDGALYAYRLVGKREVCR